MSHLLTFRKGWQSEHLARFILSKFSFIAEPSNISDDLGSDFFCTIFSIAERKYLQPQNSISIQIKSNKREIEVSNKLDYLMNIEIPFFVGVINRKQHSLVIYSGEVIPHFFSKFGNPSTHPHKPKTYIKLVDHRNNSDLYRKTNEQLYYMDFPKIIELKSDFEYDKNPEDLDSFKKVISKIQKNISAKKSNEYLFDFVDDTGIAVYAGSGSATTYRGNLFKRLCEAFYNIEYISNDSKKVQVSEFKTCERILLELQQEYGGIPQYLAEIYIGVKTRLKI